MKYTTILALAATASISNGAVTVQELFDGMTGAALNGQGDGDTSMGMTGTWLSNGGQNESMMVATNFDVKGTLPGLPASDGAQGGVWHNQAGQWGTNIYSSRALASSIDFSVTQEVFFSVNLRNHGDTAMGIGLASGANGSAEFVGAGLSWNTFTGGAGDAAYISHGTLDGGQGVYGQAAAEAAGSVNGRGLLVGRITINAAGNDLIDIKRYAEGSTIDALGDVTWSAQSSVDSSMSASHLLLWMNGNGGGELDAIRFGESWNDVTGVPEPSSAALLGLGGLALILRRRK